MEITYAPLSAENFGERSLDRFVRRQEIRERWLLRGDGALELVPCVFVEDWDESERRDRAKQMAEGLASGSFGFGAFDGGELVGFALVNPERLGSRGQYMDLEKFHVSAPYRGRRIGKELFRLAANEARSLGGEKLYISANSSAETQAVYRRLGCVLAEEILPYYAENEPFDVQMEFRL